MNLVALRSLFGRKLRTILTMIAIVLGVSMISGTYILTDTINQAFTQIFHQANSSADVIVTSQTAIAGPDRGQGAPAFPAHLLSVVRSTPGVAAAEGGISDRAVIVGQNGESLGATQGAPSLLLSALSPRFAVLTLVSGHAPHGHDVALDRQTMARRKLHLGQEVGLIAVNALERFTIVGIVKFGSVGSMGGATLIETDLPTAQRLTDKRGRYDTIRVAASSGVTPRELVRRIDARVPRGLRSTVNVETAQHNADAQAASIAQGLGSLTNVLLAFGAIALFVGAFVIFNTFSITVAQRAREFALLRTLGATRAQVLRSVVMEAFVVGAVASALGFFTGLALAKGLNRLFVAFGIDLPNSGLVIATRTVVVALVVGIVVTVLSSLMPAIRATRVPPIAALREGATLPPSRWQHLASILGVGLASLGVALMAAGIFLSIDSTSRRLTLIGAGALALFLGVAMVSPRLVGPLAAVLGWPVEKLTHITGRLARENVARNPTRTAITAAALMVGLAVVGFVTIFAAELKTTALDALDRELAGTYAIYNDQGRTVPDGAAAVVARVRGVAAVSSIKVAGGRAAGIGAVQVNGVEPATFARVYRFQWKVGGESTLRSLRPYEALADDGMATSHHLSVGSTVRVVMPTGMNRTFRIRGIYKASQLLPDLTVRYDTLTRDWRLHNVEAILVDAGPHQNLAALKKRIVAALLRSYPTAAVHSQQDLKDQNTRSIDSLLNLIYLLLAMSVLVSLFGIINTLVLSIYERTREIGMLRAIGTTRAQVRWIIRWESVITSVIGAILGLVLGIVLAVMVTAGLQSQGIEYALPVGRLLLWVVFAIIFGIVAAAFPARRAARLDVLRAISYE